jgi:hypothetical protein
MNRALVGLKLGLRMALASAIQLFPTVLIVKSLNLWTPNSAVLIGAYTGSFTLLGFFEGLSPYLFLSEEKRKEPQPNRFIGTSLSFLSEFLLLTRWN